MTSALGDRGGQRLGREFCAQRSRRPETQKRGRCSKIAALGDSRETVLGDRYRLALREKETALATAELISQVTSEQSRPRGEHSYSRTRGRRAHYELARARVRALTCLSHLTRVSIARSCCLTCDLYCTCCYI